MGAATAETGASPHDGKGARRREESGVLLPFRTNGRGQCACPQVSVLVRFLTNCCEARVLLVLQQRLLLLTRITPQAMAWRFIGLRLVALDAVYGVIRIETLGCGRP